MSDGSYIARVLLLYDEPELMVRLHDDLREEGHMVERVVTLEEFEERFEKDGYDVVVIDREPPGASGIEIVRRLRARSSAGVIMASCSADHLDHIVALETGADDVLRKPIDPREMRARVRAVLRRTLGAGRRAGLAETPEVLTFAGLSLDTAARRLFDAGGCEIHLTDAEFDVLRVLAGRLNRVVSREEILAAMKGPEWTYSGRPVDVLVSRLRHKIFGGDEAHERIRTVRGVGYMLTDGVTRIPG